MNTTKQDLFENLLNLKSNDSSVPPPTFLSVIGRQYDEDLISRVIAYLLENDIDFVKRMVDYYQSQKGDAQLDTDSISEVEVTCERATDNGRVDIFVIARGASKDITLTIENKIKTWEHDVPSGEKQTVNYYNAIKREYSAAYNSFFYLTPDWNKSMPASDWFIKITYTALLPFICNVSDPIISDFQNHIRAFLREDTPMLSEKDEYLAEHYKEINDEIKGFENRIKSIKSRIVESINQRLEETLEENIPVWNSEMSGQLKPESYYCEKATDNSRIGISSYRVSKPKWYKKGQYYLYVEILFEDGFLGKHIKYQCTVKAINKELPKGLLENNPTYRFVGPYYYVLCKDDSKVSVDSFPQNWQIDFSDEAVNRIQQLLEYAEQQYNLFLSESSN